MTCLSCKCPVHDAHAHLCFLGRKHSTQPTFRIEKREGKMQSKAATTSTTPKKASPPCKKLRTADFGSLIRRSHSVTESPFADIDMTLKSYKEKKINDT